MAQSAEPLLRAPGEEGVNLELSLPVFNNGSPSPSHFTERIIKVSRSLADFELELNLPRCLLRREMVFLGTPPQAAIPGILPVGGEEVLALWIWTRLGGWFRSQRPRGQGGRSGFTDTWFQIWCRELLEASFSAVGS